MNPKYYSSNWAGGSRAGITTYNAAKVGSRIVKGSALVTVGLGAYNIRQGYIQDGSTIGYNTYVASAETTGGAIGAWAGAEAGAALGAGIGVWFGGIGAVPGAIVGGVVGGVLGGWGGAELGEAAVNAHY